MKDRIAVLFPAPCSTALKLKTKPNQKQEDKMLNRTIRAYTQHMYNIIRFITIIQGYYWKTEVQIKKIYITLSAITGFLGLYCNTAGRQSSKLNRDAKHPLNSNNETKQNKKHFLLLHRLNQEVCHTQ